MFIAMSRLSLLLTSLSLSFFSFVKLLAPWVNSEAGLASSSGSAASFHLSLNVSAASPQEVSWRPGSGVLRIACVYSLTLLLFLVPFLDDASNPNDPGFEICSFICTHVSLYILRINFSILKMH